MVIDLPGVSGYVKRKRSVRQVSAALQYRNGISGLFFVYLPSTIVIR
jgi:hypothetical protein